MLIYWLANGSPHYISMEPAQTIAYISDVGATELKPLFIVGSCITTVFLDASFAADRWLRHKGTLIPNTTILEKVLSGIAILGSLVGTIGLICLSIFDTVNYPHTHDIFLGTFIVGYMISAIFLCAEYQRLGIKWRDHRVLRISFWVKLTFGLLELALAIVFGLCTKYKRNVAAVTEWVIALIFTFWVLSFLIDLLPAVTRGRRLGGRHKGGNLAGVPEEGSAGLEIGNGEGLRAFDGQEANEDAPRRYGHKRSTTPGAVEPSINF